MTSYILASIADRPSSYPAIDDKCTFCKIIADTSRAHIVYEDDLCIAFLDIFPLRPGHTLLVPKHHCPRLSDLPEELGGAMGKALPKVCYALTEATGNKDLNMVCNQGYAQAVHVHWHLIPAPLPPSKPSSSSSKSIPTPKTSTKLSSLYSQLTSGSLSPSAASALSSLASHKDKPAPTHMEMLYGEMKNRDYLDDGEAEVLIEKIKSRL